MKMPTASPFTQLLPPVVAVRVCGIVATEGAGVASPIPAVKFTAVPLPSSAAKPSSSEQPPERSSPASSAPPESVRATYLKFFSVLIFSLFIIYIIRLPKRQRGFS